MSDCKTGADANDDADCARVAVALSLEQYWAATLPDGGPSGGFFRDAQPLPSRRSIMPRRRRGLEW